MPFPLDPAKLDSCHPVGYKIPLVSTHLLYPAFPLTAVLFEDLNLFKDFDSDTSSYFEKLENVYSCNINLYFSDKYCEYCIKNNFPEKWLDFGKILFDLFNFDVLNITHLEKIVTNLFFDIKRDGVYDLQNNKLDLTSLEFGHYEVHPHDMPKSSIIINVKKSEIAGYFEKENADLVLTDYSASRVHARIIQEDGAYYLEDLNSTNGTFKNGLRMQPYEKRKLESGDEVKFAKTEYIYR